MMNRLAKQQNEIKATLMQLEDRRAEREAEQRTREFQPDDRMLDLLSNIVMCNSGMTMPCQIHRMSCHQCPMYYHHHHLSMDIMYT